MFNRANHQTGLQLDEVELSVEINAQGQVRIMVSGGSLSDRGAIKLKFKRASLFCKFEMELSDPITIKRMFGNTEEVAKELGKATEHESNHRNVNERFRGSR